MGACHHEHNWEGEAQCEDERDVGDLVWVRVRVRVRVSVRVSVRVRVRIRIRVGVWDWVWVWVFGLGFGLGLDECGVGHHEGASRSEAIQHVGGGHAWLGLEGWG